MTPIEAARIRLEGAKSNHKTTRHLRRLYEWATAKDVALGTKLAKSKEQELPLFEVKQ